MRVKIKKKGQKKKELFQTPKVKKIEIPEKKERPFEVPEKFL